MSESESLWNNDRVKRYIKLYGNPRKQRGPQSQLCADSSRLIIGSDVIDFGCGMGHLVPYVTGKYIGLDNSPHMLEALKEFFPQHEVHQVDVTGDLSELNLSCDTAVSNSLFIHLATTEMMQTLRNMWKVAREGIVFSMETKGDKEHIRQDGIRIRNQTPKNVVKTIMTTLDIDEKQISWGHQCIQYTMDYIVTPSLSSPLELVNRGMVARTTLFRVDKQ